MIVVSNTTPLNYLILMRKEEILPSLFGSVVTPPAVVEELSRHKSPELVRQWISAPPSWLRIQAPLTVSPFLDLDIGEREAIALAQELSAERVLLDEAKARRAAVALGLRVSGTLAILFEAGERGLLDMNATLDELRQTTFYVDENLIQAMRDRVSKRRD